MIGLQSVLLWLFLSVCGPWSLSRLATAAATRETGVVGGCEMSWMSPSTILLDGLTEEESRLAKKYSLHLYREREWDVGIEHGVRCPSPFHTHTLVTGSTSTEAACWRRKRTNRFMVCLCSSYQEMRVQRVRFDL